MNAAAMRLLAGSAALLLGAPAASAASCPSTCVTFDEAADAERFVILIAGTKPGDAAEFLKQQLARHTARSLPSGTQFVLLSEHKVPEAKSIYYGIHLPGGDATRYLVAVK